MKSIKVKLTVAEAADLFMATRSAIQTSKFAPAIFGFAMALNDKSLLPYYESFDRARLDLAKAHAGKDENGEPIMIVEGENSRFDIKDMAAFNAALAEVRDAEIEVDLMQVDLEKFPEQIAPAIVTGLMPIIKTPDAEAA